MINCAVIKDLLPLYADDVLSEESKELVSEHLATCESCKNELANMQSEIEKPQHDDKAKINALKSMKKKIFKQKAVSVVVIIFFAFAIHIVINFLIIINAVVPTDSMADTIQAGDRLIAFRGSYLFRDPSRYDIVVFRGPTGGLNVKRILGLPGESLLIVDGHVYINGASVPQRYDFVRGPLTGNYGVVNPVTGALEPFVIPEGHFFMLGDNRANSHDSRHWNEPFVSRDRILGRVVFRYFRGFARLRN